MLNNKVTRYVVARTTATNRRRHRSHSKRSPGVVDRAERVAAADDHARAQDAQGHRARLSRLQPLARRRRSVVSQMLFLFCRCVRSAHDDDD
jgi:hypothetical protein